MEIFLIRHTSPKIEKGICYGQSEVPLSKSFNIEARRLLNILPEAIEAIYTSPLGRCRKLAEFINFKKVVADERLLEMNFGDWEMKKWNDVDQANLNNWMKNFVKVRTPNGESFLDLNKRINNFIKELQKCKYEKIAIVTHGGVIRCFMAKFLKISLEDSFNIPVDYSSVTKIILK